MAREVIRIPNRDKLLQVVPGYDRTFPFHELVTTGVYNEMFDFTEVAIDATNKYNVGVANSATTPTIVASGGLVNGVVRNTTSTTASGASAISGQLVLQGQLNCGIEARVKISAITSAKFEVGLCDTVAANGFTSIVATAATPTFNTSGDAVAWVFDTTRDATLPAYMGIKGGVVTATTAGPAVTAIVAATYQTFGVFLRDTTAFFYVLDNDGHLLFQSAGLVSAVTSTVSLCWFVDGVTRNTSSKNLDLDYVRSWQRRTTA